MGDTQSDGGLYAQIQRGAIMRRAKSILIFFLVRDGGFLSPGIQHKSLPLNHRMRRFQRG